MDSRRKKVVITTKLMLAASALVCALLFVIILILFSGSLPLLKQESIINILFSSFWNPGKGGFGLYPIIIGTVYVTGIAMLFSVPVSILSSIYIAEYAEGRVRNIIKSFVDVLAGVPSVVYGMCAIIVLVPLVRDYMAPFLGATSTGFCILTAGMILAIMVFPIIISICVDVFRAVPNELREVSYAIGATKWETIKHVVFRAAFPIPRLSSSVFEPGTTLAAFIATNFGEMMSVPFYYSAMMLMALILILVVLIFNIIAKIIIRKSYGGGGR
ncbi:MAG: hypothetical protein A7315_12885 [Candidatus Altiarchaeales archaeon WOR_SM1_79]|nr:MAG: hypothetical protein A7315_12885 [Candidatus Altiarchaeales archaeon WOR_SM1_79]